jgi:hypothetical protein
MKLDICLVGRMLCAACCRNFLAVLDAMCGRDQGGPGLVGAGLATGTCYPIPATEAGDVRIMHWNACL